MAFVDDSPQSPVQIFYDKIKEVAGEEYGALCQLKIKGKQSQDYEEHFQQQRHAAETATDSNPELCHKWYINMSKILREVDDELSVFPKGRGFYFLDLGCSPGGFARYIFWSNGFARGTGVSLPPQQGGHKNLLEGKYLRRLTLVEADMTMFNLTPDKPSLLRDSLPMEPVPSCISSRQFEFVICDAHPIRTGAIAPPPLLSQRLLLSQFVMALERLTHPEQLYTAQYMYMFDRVSDGQVSVKKPETMHGTRGSFYLVAKNVGGTDESRAYLETYLEELRRLWWEISRVGARALMYGDMNFVAPLETLIRPEVLARIVELGEPVWSVQLRHLERLDLKLALAKRGRHAEE
ncbi:hypothetical protein BDZ89DRAFT_1079546 [Hymenopellis radicata]|nr:hypothetical protein BDZ89DRAFT_1079546 [Hymenopellis radicata]